MMTPISGDGDVASHEDYIINWRHTRWPVGEDVDAQQQRYNRPAVQAETPVGDRRGGRSVKTWMPKNGGIIGQPCRRRHQSAAVKASRSVKTRRYQSAVAKAETPVGGGEGKPAVKA
uniref:Plasmodium vivax circumsporozoite protein-like protein n=1 Tax=Oryza sativa subsp. japonica TaxID=39947 RepID=Q6Z5R2_ORYSJ|nr:plasmodium vivax circumsporozoite protein-like protein [Oryza sativa Japonica Group]